MAEMSNDEKIVDLLETLVAEQRSQGEALEEIKGLLALIELGQ